MGDWDDLAESVQLGTHFRECSMIYLSNFIAGEAEIEIHPHWPSVRTARSRLHYETTGRDRTIETASSSPIIHRQ